jgi:hypothetical protein
MSSHVSLLVTGERDWPTRDDVWQALDDALEQHSWETCRLFVGDCPSGADHFAFDWFVSRFGLPVLDAQLSPNVRIYSDAAGECHLGVFVANWNVDGQSAGPKRNRRMVAAFANDGGAKHASAFWSGKRAHSGTLDCMAALVEAGIDVQVVSRGRK